MNESSSAALNGTFFMWRECVRMPPAIFILRGCQSRGHSQVSGINYGSCWLRILNYMVLSSCRMVNLVLWADFLGDIRDPFTILLDMVTQLSIQGYLLCLCQEPLQNLVKPDQGEKRRSEHWGHGAQRCLGKQRDVHSTWNRETLPHRGQAQAVRVLYVPARKSPRFRAGEGCADWHDLFLRIG